MSRASRTPSANPARKDEHDHPGLSITVEKGAQTAKVQVTLTAIELERARGREFQQLSHRVTLKGFRPGKTPRAMLEKHYGAEVEQSVLEHFMQHAYQHAVEEHKLRPATLPRVPVGDRMPKKGEDWSVSFEILLRPELTLGQVDGLEIEGKPTAVVDEEVERALVEIRRANSRPEPASEEPLAAEGMAVATLDFFRAGSEESCLTREGLRLAPKVPPQGVDGKTFEETLVGARAGEERSMDMEFPANFPVLEARGEKGRVRFTLKEVYRITPPSDEELYRAFEATDDASLRTNLKARMEVAKGEAEEQRLEGELLERLIAAHPMHLPEQIVLEQVEAHHQELLAKLREQGLSEEAAAKQAESERGRARESAEKALRAVYLIEEVARAKDLRVDQNDLTQELNAIAARNGTPPAEVARYYREQGLLRQLGLELLERKVRRYLRASAVVRPAPG